MKVFIIWTLVLLIILDLKIVQATETGESSSSSSSSEISSTTATPATIAKPSSSKTSEIDKCSNKTCNNNGTCTAEGKCNCTAGYDGENCENVTEIDKCSNKTCNNNGTCTAAGKCNCTPGYDGENCENFTEIDKCSNKICNNNGTCTAAGKCNCTAGYNGENCENVTEIDKCSNKTCNNNGTCTADGKCNCTAGYDGKNCENEIDKCSNKTCNNNGTCTADGKCKCTAGYDGENCENEIDKCSDQTCHNNGTCTADGKCNCTPGYDGENCENANPTPKLFNTDVKISYELVINITFNATLGKKDSEEYNETCNKYGKILQTKFQGETGVTDLIVKVTDFKNGSLIVLYDVIVPNLKNKTDKNLIALDVKFKNAATNWTNEQTFGGKIDIERTKRVFKNTFLQAVCYCVTEEYVCVSEHTDTLRCEHKCNSATAKSCLNNGHCVYDRVSKEATCLCRNIDSKIFYGENCEHILETNSTTTTTTKIATTSEPFPVSKLTIIAISGGTGGALLLIILISTICFCYRLKHAKRKGSFSETSSKCDSDIIRDNKKMESIPLESGKLNPGYRDGRQESGRRYPLEQPHTTKSNPLYRDDFGDRRKGYQTDPEPRYHDHDRISRELFNPQISNDRPITEYSGNRQPVKNNNNNDSEHSYRNQQESENSYRPQGFSSERNTPRGLPEEISRDRNNSRWWSEEYSNDRNKLMGRSEEFNGDRNNTRRWPEENSNDRNYPKGRSGESRIDDDRYVYIEGDGGVRRLFKRIDDKDFGGETLIYQPSNMPRPIQRENVDSVGDNFIMRPAPQQDNESRRSFYDTIDSESPYKIQRPIIKHNNLYS